MAIEIAYFDSSALVKTLMREPESAALRRFMRSLSVHASSRLVVTEVLRAVRRFDTAWTPRAQAMLRRIVVFEITNEILLDAGMLDPPELRTLDAVHVVTARTLGDELAAVVTYDGHMATAATRLGLPVETPA